MQVGDCMFIDPTNEPAQLRFLPWFRVEPDPARHAAERHWVYVGKVESLSDHPEGHQIRHRLSGALVDLGWYLDAQGYVLAED